MCGCGRCYLQRVPRTGWVYRNVKRPESVSDHMYRMAMMSLTITDPAVDKDRWVTHTLSNNITVSAQAPLADGRTCHLMCRLRQIKVIHCKMIHRLSIVY